jgi:carbon-monoxide dehydrogenase medium subunit
MVVRDARPIIADGAPERFDGRAADDAAISAGMNDPLDRQQHVVALRRSVERAARR